MVTGLVGGDDGAQRTAEKRRRSARIIVSSLTPVFPEYADSLAAAGERHDCLAKLAGKVLVVIINDTHVGLCPTGFYLDDGAEVKLNPLLKHWNGFWQRRGLPVVILFVADLIDGNHHHTTQIWSPNEEDMAVKIFLPQVNRAERVYGVRGTPAHVGSAGRYDNAVMRELGAGKPSAYHAEISISGVLFDVAHHGPGIGKKAWTAISYAKNVLFKRLLRRRRAPRVIVRAHVHRKLHETVRDPHSGAIISPAWQFVHKIETEEDIADVGGTLVTVEDGQVLSVEFDCIEKQQSRHENRRDYRTCAGDFRHAFLARTN